ncbi:MAG: hypothetical protein WC492_05325 [Candidatus Micrarchaeia archaeon]
MFNPSFRHSPSSPGPNSGISDFLRQKKILFYHRDFKKELDLHSTTFRQAWKFAQSIPDDWYFYPKFKSLNWMTPIILVDEAKLDGGYIRAEVFTYSKSHRMTYTLRVEEKTYFIKETSCNKPLGRWGPFEMAGLLDLVNIAPDNVKIVLALASLSDGKKSMIVSDFLPMKFQTATLEDPLYTVYSNFVNAAVELGYWELGGDNFFFDKRSQIVYAYDPFCNMSDAKNISNLLRVASLNPDYILNTNF